MENRLEQPNVGIKKELHDIYESVFKSSLPIAKKERILNSIFGYENWSWRVVGISKKAINVFKNNEFKYKSGVFQRDHYFQARYITMRKMLENFMKIDEWWNWYWENDKTLLITKDEHSKKNYSLDKDIIEIDWSLGYFVSNPVAGFYYTQKREGKFLRELIKKNNL